MRIWHAVSALADTGHCMARKTQDIDMFTYLLQVIDGPVNVKYDFHGDCIMIRDFSKGVSTLTVKSLCEFAASLRLQGEYISKGLVNENTWVAPTAEHLNFPMSSTAVLRHQWEW